MSVAATLLLSIESSEVAKGSNLDIYRGEREDQSSIRRTEIVDAAEALFLERGIAATTMMDIAESTSVSRVTLYRYFADRDQVAFEVAGRMLSRLAATGRAAAPPDAKPIEAVRAGFRAFITEFDSNRDAHRFLAMFDNLRPYRDSPTELVRWYRVRSYRAYAFDDEQIAAQRFDADTTARLITFTNTLMGVLARYATNGEVLAREQGIVLPAQFQHLEEMMLGYFDAVIAPHARLRAVGDDS